jgi:hypothetical protein
VYEQQFRKEKNATDFTDYKDFQKTYFGEIRVIRYPIPKTARPFIIFLAAG